jgi:hypothetical protein
MLVEGAVMLSPNVAADQPLESFPVINSIVKSS